MWRYMRQGQGGKDAAPLRVARASVDHCPFARYEQGMSGPIVHPASRRRVPALLPTGVLLLAVLQALYLGSVAGVTQRTILDSVAEIVRANMTPLAWCAYLLILTGFLGRRMGTRLARGMRTSLV